MRFIGWDLTDAFAKQPRPIDVASLDNSGRVTFATLDWPANKGLDIDRSAVLSLVPGNDDVLVIDGPQGMASAGNQLRECERLLNAPGRTPDRLPVPGRPFMGYIRSSLQLFEALRTSGRLLHLPQTSVSVATIFEAFPAATWKALASASGLDLAAKASHEGRTQRMNLLSARGVAFGSGLPTHDQLDAAICALLARMTRSEPNSVRLVGAPVALDTGGQLREGCILDAISQPALARRIHVGTSRVREIHTAPTRSPAASRGGATPKWVYLASRARAGMAATLEFVERNEVICWPAHNTRGARQSNASAVQPGDRMVFCYRGGQLVESLAIVEILEATSGALAGVPAMARLPQSLAGALALAGYKVDPSLNVFTGFYARVIGHMNHRFQTPGGQGTLRKLVDVPKALP